MLEKKCRKLISDFDYVYSNGKLCSKTIKGFTTARLIGGFSSALQAAEHLIPIIKEDEYTNSFLKITNQIGN